MTKNYECLQNSSNVSLEGPREREVVHSTRLHSPKNEGIIGLNFFLHLCLIIKQILNKFFLKNSKLR